ncbi:TPA: hypothetical protein ACGOVD_000666 [Streptococcus suis]
MNRLSHKQLSIMFLYDFGRSLAENSLKLVTALLLSLYPVAGYASHYLPYVSVIDSLLPFLAVTYTMVWAAFTSQFPKYVVEHANPYIFIKNALYLVYLFLLPLSLILLLGSSVIIKSLGLPYEEVFPYYLVYILSVLLTNPIGLLIPTYYRVSLQSGKAVLLSWVMCIVTIVGLFFVILIKPLGIVAFPIVSAVANSIPFGYFLIENPQFLKGFDFNWELIKTIFRQAKWEVVRFLIPRVANMFITVGLYQISPSLASAKYIISSVLLILDGFVSSSSNVSMINISHNYGIGHKDIQEGRRFILWLSWVSLTVTSMLVIGSSGWWLPFVSKDSGALSSITPMIWGLGIAEVALRIRYYNLLSITRVAYSRHNGVLQSMFGFISAFGATLLIPIFAGRELLGASLVTLSIMSIQWFICELYVRYQKII